MWHVGSVRCLEEQQLSWQNHTLQLMVRWRWRWLEMAGTRYQNWFRWLASGQTGSNSTSRLNLLSQMWLLPSGSRESRPYLSILSPVKSVYTRLIFRVGCPNHRNSSSDHAHCSVSRPLPRSAPIHHPPSTVIVRERAGLTGRTITTKTGTFPRLTWFWSEIREGFSSRRLLSV